MIVKKGKRIRERLDLHNKGRMQKPPSSSTKLILPPPTIHAVLLYPLSFHCGSVRTPKLNGAVVSVVCYSTDSSMLHAIWTIVEGAISFMGMITNAASESDSYLVVFFGRARHAGKEEPWEPGYDAILIVKDWSSIKSTTR